MRDFATAATPSDGLWHRLVRRLRLEGMSNRSLFIFGEHNFVRKYAKIIIEWGYPLCIILSLTSSFSVRNSQYCYAEWLTGFILTAHLTNIL